jgi:hypothetical protein
MARRVGRWVKLIPIFTGFSAGAWCNDGQQPGAASMRESFQRPAEGGDDDKGGERPKQR